jgi:formylglycine-generating enzyme required for sulfatase activity
VKIEATETHCPIKKGTPFFLEDIGMDMVWIELLDSWVAKSEVTQEQFAKGGGKFRRQRYKGPDRAQNSVSWNQAMEFCRALTDNEKQKGHLPEGFVFTLPSEDQWKVFVGDAGPNHAVYGNRESKGPSPPGTRSENQYGLVDVRGNLWEWTLTDYSSQNPSKGKALRGGSFVTSRSMLMNDNARFYGDKNNSYYQYGFRFVLTTEKS